MERQSAQFLVSYSPTFGLNIVLTTFVRYLWDAIIYLDCFLIIVLSWSWICTKTMYLPTNLYSTYFSKVSKWHLPLILLWGRKCCKTFTFSQNRAFLKVEQCYVTQFCLQVIFVHTSESGKGQARIWIGLSTPKLWTWLDEVVQDDIELITGLQLNGHIWNQASMGGGGGYATWPPMVPSQLDLNNATCNSALTNVWFSKCNAHFIVWSRFCWKLDVKWVFEVVF